MSPRHDRNGFRLEADLSSSPEQSDCCWRKIGNRYYTCQDGTQGALNPRPVEPHMSRARLRTSDAHTHSSVCQAGEFLHDCSSAGEKQSVQLKLEKISVKVWQLFLMCCS